MDDAAIQETRRLLRKVQEHLLLAHAAFGAQRETLNLVEVVHHPANALADFNYVTPRRNTAWVSSNFIQTGLDHLRDLKRTPRVQYIEGLFLPMFARALRDLGLTLEREIPLMIYTAEGVAGIKPPAPVALTLPESVQLQTVSDQRGRDLWWHVWRNAFFDVQTLGVEPVAVSGDIQPDERQQDIILYQHHFPVGVVRLTFQPDNGTAHIVALALQREERSPDKLRLLLTRALETALARGCSVVFAPGETEDDRRLYRDLGFIDLGSIVCYAASSAIGKTAQDELVQPLLTIRG
jgi:hypothetical protein